MFFRRLTNYPCDEVRFISLFVAQQCFGAGANDRLSKALCVPAVDQKDVIRGVEVVIDLVNTRLFQLMKVYSFVSQADCRDRDKVTPS